MKLKKETGLTQQPRELHPALPPDEIQGTHTEHTDTTSSPWSDEGDADDPEYLEQSDNPVEHSGDNSPIKGKNENTPDQPQSQHENPELSINTGYPDTQGTQIKEQESISMCVDY